MNSERKLGLLVVLLVIALAGSTMLARPNGSPALPDNVEDIIEDEVNRRLTAGDVDQCWLELWVHENSTGRFLGKKAVVTNIAYPSQNATYCGFLKQTCTSDLTGAYCTWEDHLDGRGCSCYWYDEQMLQPELPPQLVAQYKQLLDGRYASSLNHRIKAEDISPWQYPYSPGHIATYALNFKPGEVIEYMKENSTYYNFPVSPWGYFPVKLNQDGLGSGSFRNFTVSLDIKDDRMGSNGSAAPAVCIHTDPGKFTCAEINAHVEHCRGILLILRWDVDKTWNTSSCIRFSHWYHLNWTVLSNGSSWAQLYKYENGEPGTGNMSHLGTISYSNISNLSSNDIYLSIYRYGVRRAFFRNVTVSYLL